jgi:Tat protein secretion system quality control protein TatD with DNase activity
LIPLREVSKLKNVKIEEVAKKTTNNFLNIFEL